MISFQSQGRQNIQWWAKDVREKEHDRLFQVIERLRLQDQPRREACLRRMRMYGNFAPWSTTQVHLPGDRLRYNLAKQCVDTLAAEIASSKPKAAFLVDGGDWTLRQAAKACEHLVEAQMRDAGLYDGLARQWLKDAEITGTGILYDYICRDTMTVKLERVLPLELLVDEADGRYGKPRSIYRQRVMDRAVLIGLYPKMEHEIRKAQRFNPTGVEEWLLRDAGESDLVLVVEAWHLRSSKKADDGRYVVAIKNATLHSEEYECKSFPFTILRWEEAPVGFWGVGVVEQLESDQIELNRTLRRIQEAGGAAAGMWLVPHESKIKGGHITDVPGAIIRYAGGLKPEYVQPGTIPMDLIQHADRIIARGMQRLGISEAFANAIKPVGLNSGEAQRVHSDMYSMRQSPHSQAWDSAHVALAKRMVKRNEEIWEDLTSRKRKDGEDEDFDKYAVQVEVKRGRRKVLKRLRFSEVRLPENQYVMQAYPMSSLPSQPSGRAALLKEWIEAGLIDQETARAMEDLPDTEGALRLDLADYDFALFCFETMVEDGTFVSPEPYQNLEKAMELMRRSYLRGVIDGVPDDRLDLVRDHMDQIKVLIQKAKPAPAPAPMPAADPAMVDPMMQGMAPAVPSPDMMGSDPSTLGQVAA